MWFAVVAHDAPDTLAQRLAARVDHLARLNVLQGQGRLKIAGPLPAIDQENPGEAGFIGSLVVVEFDTRELLQAWLDADPYVAAGVYTHVDIYPFKPVLP